MIHAYRSPVSSRSSCSRSSATDRQTRKRRSERRSKRRGLHAACIADDTVRARAAGDRVVWGDNPITDTYITSAKTSAIKWGYIFCEKKRARGIPTRHAHKWGGTRGTFPPTRAYTHTNTHKHNPKSIRRVGNHQKHSRDGFSCRSALDPTRRCSCI